MEEDAQDRDLHVPWTDLASNSYGNIPSDEATPDLLESDSPSQSPAYRRHINHHSNNQHHHHSHHQQQPELVLEHQLQQPPSITYITQTHGLYSTIPEAETGSHFEYGNYNVQDLIHKTRSEMRTEQGGDGNVGGEGSSRKGSKRKRGDKYEEDGPQNKMDASQRCDVCGEQASGHYFGALVCLPCKSFFIRCTKDGRPNFNNQCDGKCDVLKGGRVRCQHCRFQKCISAGMYRKEKPEAVEPAEGQVLCRVCGDISNGVHFGVTTCEGCKKFFRRGLKENKTYNCKGNMHCSINPRMRNNCRYCRYQKCLYEGMSREAIKMGRPKKGELSYRKSQKKNGLQHVMKSLYGQQLSEEHHLSISSESDLDDEVVSASGDVFDPLSAGHHLQIDTRQLNSHVQHPYGQVQQQAGTFSLGSILHECMTVRDWDQKVEMPDLDQNTASSHTNVMTPLSSRHGQNLIEDCEQINPNIRNSSPSMLSDMLGRQLQQQQLHHHHHQQQQQSHPSEILNHLQENIQLRRQNVVFEDPSLNTNSAEFLNEHNFNINRNIKLENVSLHAGHANEYTNEEVIEDIKNVKRLNTDDFQAFQMQDFDLSQHYSVNERLTNSVPSSVVNMGTPNTRTGPSAGLQVVAMSSQGVLYRAQRHQESITRDLNHNHQTMIPTLHHQTLLQNNMGEESAQMSSNIEQNQEMNMANPLLSSNVSCQIITHNGNIRTAVHNPNALTNHPHTHNMSISPRNAYKHYNGNYQQQFASDSRTVSTENGSSLLFESVTPTKSSNKNENTFSIRSFSLQNNTSAVSTSLASASDVHTNGHQKLLETRSPISALLQQHRDAIQTGRSVHLSSEEVEELLNTVKTEHQRKQGFVINDQNQSSVNRGTSYQNSIDLRTHQPHNFLIKDEQIQIEELNNYNRQTPPQSVTSYQYYNQSNQYPNRSMTNQNITEINKRHYQNHISISSDSCSSDRQELNTEYNNISNNINNNNNIRHNNSNVNSRTSSYTSGDIYNRNSPVDEVNEDNYNSTIARDSIHLHEINRIFLGIDNSCDTYRCNSPSTSLRENSQDDSSIVPRMSADYFSPEISHRYWHGFQPSQRMVPMTSDRQKILHDVMDAFDDLQRTYVENEPEYFNRKIALDQTEHWHHIQRRIARHVVAGQRFCRNIPGYFKLDIQDRISLGKHVGFGLMVIIACTEFYDPEFKRFKHIWNWTIPMQNPLFSYKVHLLSLGDRINDLKINRTEASMVCAISMTSIDCPNLLKPEIVCVLRDTLIDALSSYILSRNESNSRLKKLLGIMPQVRLMTVWYNNLMKKMSLPSEIINRKISKPKVDEINDTENIPNIS